MQNESSVSYFTIPHSKNMPAKYNNESSCEFHEVHQNHSSSVGRPPKQHVVNKRELESQCNPRLMSKQGITASSPSSSSSSLTTGSIFSLSDYSSASKRYKTTETQFNNFDLVSYDPKIDPQPCACYNCWHFNHKYYNCSEIKIHKYCYNCGPQGVAMQECPRCARAYVDNLDRSNRHCNEFVSRIEVEKPMDDVQLNIIEERCDECWDEYVEDDHKSSEVSFSHSLQKRETEYQHDDWDNYQSPRLNLIKKSSKLYSLNATKAEVAKYKDDNWSDCEVVGYSYSWGEHSYKTDGTSFVDPEKRANKVEDWDYFGKDDAKEEFSQNLDKNDQFKSSNTSENERAKYHVEEAFKNSNEGSVSIIKTTNLIIKNESKVLDEIISESECIESSTGMYNTANVISSEKESSVDQNDWSDQNEEVLENSGKSCILEFKEQNLNILQNKNIQDEKEDWSDSEDYQSLQVSFCDKFETGNHMAALNSRIDEEYWTDFDDDYESLQASFTEEYKSLDNTIEDETDCTNTFATDILNSEDKPGFHDIFYANRDPESNELFSFIKNEKIDDLFAAKQSYDKNICQSNSLESSFSSQSDEAYLSNDEDVDDYEYMIVDENERSEPIPFAGQAVQEFLNLLDSLKHLPIQTQNVAVLHFISKQKEQSWQSPMQNRI